MNTGYSDVIDFAPHVQGVSELHDATLHEVGAWYSNGDKAKEIEELKTQLAETKRMWENSSRINRDLQEKLTEEWRELHKSKNHAHQLDEALKRTYRTCMDEIEKLKKLNKHQQDLIHEQAARYKEKIEQIAERNEKELQLKIQDAQQYRGKLRAIHDLILECSQKSKLNNTDPAWKNAIDYMIRIAEIIENKQDDNQNSSGATTQNTNKLRHQKQKKSVRFVGGKKLPI